MTTKQMCVCVCNPLSIK